MIGDPYPPKRETPVAVSEQELYEGEAHEIANNLWTIPTFEDKLVIPSDQILLGLVSLHNRLCVVRSSRSDGTRPCRPFLDVNENLRDKSLDLGVERQGIDRNAT